MAKKKGKATRFVQGYLCALSCIYHSHGGDVMIDEALRAICAKNIDPITIDDFDRDMLIKFQTDGAT